MKLCKDCKYSHVKYNNTYLTHCTRKPKMDRVNGGVDEEDRVWCASQRVRTGCLSWLFAIIDGNCGPQGRFWKELE